MKRSLRHIVVTALVFLSGVNAAIETHAQDIRDVKPPVAFPAPWMLWGIALGVILFAGIAYLAYQWHQRQKIQAAGKIITKTPWEKAYERLDALVNSGLLKRGEWEQYYSTLSDIVRRYFEERFDIRAPEMTSEEFLVSLRNFTGLTEPSKALLQEFLTASDMVKFAKYTPDAAAGEKNAALVRRMIDETKS